MSNELQQFKDSVAVAAFGITKAAVQQQGLCISCKQPAIPKCYSYEGKREYRISGMCEECFDALFKEDE